MIDLIPPANAFKFDVQTPKPGKFLVHLQGRLLDKTNGMKLYDNLILALNNEKKPQVLLNLQNLEYLNSEGLNTLIRCLSLSRKKGGDLWITQANQSLNSLFLSTRLSDLFLTIDSPQIWIELPQD